MFSLLFNENIIVLVGAILVSVLLLVVAEKDSAISRAV